MSQNLPDAMSTLRKELFKRQMFEHIRFLDVIGEAIGVKSDEPQCMWIGVLEQVKAYATKLTDDEEEQEELVDLMTLCLADMPPGLPSNQYLSAAKAVAVQAARTLHSPEMITLDEMEGYEEHDDEC